MEVWVLFFFFFFPGDSGGKNTVVQLGCDRA